MLDVLIQFVPNFFSNTFFVYSNYLKAIEYPIRQLMTIITFSVFD